MEKIILPQPYQASLIESVSKYLAVTESSVLTYVSVILN